MNLNSAVIESVNFSGGLPVSDVTRPLGVMLLCSALVTTFSVRVFRISLLAVECEIEWEERSSFAPYFSIRFRCSEVVREQVVQE